MADPEEGIKQLLAQAQGVTALVQKRIFHGIARQKSRLPYINYIRITGDHSHHMGGASGFASQRIQLDAYTETPAEMSDLREQIRLALDGFTGTVTVKGGDTITFSQLFLKDNDSDVIGPDEGGTKAIQRASMDANTWHSEPLPVFA